MAKSLYISTTNARSGKSTIVLGIMQLLLRDLQNVGFFRPIINPEDGERDHDINLVLSHFYLGMRYEDTYAMTLDEAKKTRKCRQAERDDRNDSQQVQAA